MNPEWAKTKLKLELQNDLTEQSLPASGDSGMKNRPGINIVHGNIPVNVTNRVIYKKYKKKMVKSLWIVWLY